MFVRWLETQQAEFEKSSPETWRMIRQAYTIFVSNLVRTQTATHPDTNTGILNMDSALPYRSRNQATTDCSQASLNQNNFTSFCSLI